MFLLLARLYEKDSYIVWLKSFEMTSVIAKITESLYLCSAKAIKTQPLIDIGITIIVNCTNETPTYEIHGIENHRIRVDDHPDVLLDIPFDRGADKINEICSNGGKVLVHCYSGVSRSATLCLFYLMKYKRMSLKLDYKLVKKERPIIKPNVGFWKQLLQYERRLYGRNTVNLIHGVTPDVYLNK